jgi:hypothetical protein
VSVVFDYIYIYIYTWNDLFLSSLEMVMSKKLVLLSYSSSVVNFMLGVMLLNILSASYLLVVSLLKL